jgi:hypothetical protein
MALIKCSECGREISDKAAACVGCGAPFVSAAEPSTPAPTRVTNGRSSGTFIGTKSLIVQLAAKAVHQIGWRLDAADENAGLVKFTTGMTWGSFAGVSGAIYIAEVGPYLFQASGSAKQNVLGGQVFAPNLFNEAQSKADKVIATMKSLAG